MPGRGLDATIPAWALNAPGGNVPGVNSSVPVPQKSIPTSTPILPSTSTSSGIPSSTQIPSTLPYASSVPTNTYPSSASIQQTIHQPYPSHTTNNSKHRSRSRSRSPPTGEKSKSSSSSSSSRHHHHHHHHHQRRSSRSRSPSDRHYHRRRDSRSRSRDRDAPRVSVLAALAAATGGGGNVGNLPSYASANTAAASSSSSLAPGGLPHITQMNDEEKSKLVAAALAKVGALVGNIGGFTGLSSSASSSSTASNDAGRAFRRLYIGNIPNGCTTNEVQQFFNETINKVYQPSSHISNVYINFEKRYAFVEFFSIELCTACLALDGIVWKGNTLRVRRPSDYNNNSVPPSTGPAITLRMSNIDIISSVVVDGPNKLFIGGLNKNLTEENVRTLLQSLGKLKSFQLMKENNTNFNKGYGFAEYDDPEVTEKAIAVLNNTLIVDKHITVKRALEQGNKPNNTGSTSGVATSSNMIPIGSGAQTIPNYGGIPAAIPGYNTGYPSSMMMNMYGQTGYPGTTALPQTQIPPNLNMYGYGIPATSTTTSLPSYLTTGLLPQVPMVQQQMIAPSVPTVAPSMRVIRLTNLSTPDDLATDEAYQDLVADVTEELSHYGKLDHAIIIPRTGTQAGAVYARYSQPNEALTAQASLGTRTFAGRTLGITFESEAAFAAMALGYGTSA